MRCLLIDWMRALLKRGVGDESDLAAGEADRAVALRADRHRHQGDGDLFTGCQQLIHLALGRGDLGAADGAHLLGQCDQVIGRIAHGADDDHDLVAALLRRHRPPGGAMNAFGVGDAAAAEFLYDQPMLGGPLEFSLDGPAMSRRAGEGDYREWRAILNAG